MKEILKAAAKTSAGTLITLLSSAIAIKIIAVFAGPAGIGLFSLLRQIQQTASIVGVLGGQAAIVQGLSDKGGRERAVHTGVILRIVIMTTCLVCAVIALGAPWIAQLILGELPNATGIFRLLAIPTLLGSGVLFLSGVINSHRAVGALSMVQITAGITLAAFAYFASVQPTGLRFVVLLCCSSFAGLAVAIYFCRKNSWLGPLEKGWLLSCRDGRNTEFLKVASATLITGLMGTGSVLIIRATVTQFQGYTGAGIFDAGWTLSMTYVMLILTSFSAYYLPTLGKLKLQERERNSLIQQYFRFATFSSIPLIAAVILLKPWLVELLYSREFVPAVDMMRWMLLGDFFKISSWVMAMPMLAYADMKPYVVSEFLWNVALVLLAHIALRVGSGIESIGVIFMCLYFLYFLYTYTYCKKKFKLALSPKLKLIWLSGFVFLSGISFIFP
jgi:O-antigen/teichoic acid export membrane protein